MAKFNSESKVGKIVAELPKAADLFIEKKIDFCCGGDRPLTEAVQDSNQDVTAIVNALNELYETVQTTNAEARDWSVEPLDTFVDHIVNIHHAYLWAELPRLGELSTTILRVHGVNHPELSKVHKLFGTLRIELEDHLSKEEAVQYPAIAAYTKTASRADLQRAIDIIDELEKEHTEAGDILKELQEITGDYALPADACATYELVYRKLQELELDLFQHIHLENNILFPRLRQLA